MSHVSSLLPISKSFNTLILQESTESLKIVLIFWCFLLWLSFFRIQWVSLGFLRIELFSRLLLVILKKKYVGIVLNLQIAWQLLFVFLNTIVYWEQVYGNLLLLNLLRQFNPLILHGLAVTALWMVNKEQILMRSIASHFYLCLLAIGRILKLLGW